MPKQKPLVYRASSLPRILKCTASAAVPDIDIDEAGEGAALGRAVHAVMADIVRQELDALPDLAPYAAAHGADDDELRRLAWAGLDAWRKLRPAFARVIAVEWSLRHKIAGAAVTGHADVIAEATDGALVVIDWKSGWAETDCRDQLSGYLWLATRSLVSLADEGKAIVVWLRNRAVETRGMGRAELDDWEVKLADAIRRPNVYAPGERCLWCPRRNDCPARRELVRAATADLTADDAEKPRVLSRDRVAELWPRARLLKQALERYDAAVRSTLADGGPLALADGRELALDERTRKEISFARGLAVIREALGGQDPVVALGDAVKVGRRALLDAVADRAPKRGKGKAREAAMKALTEAGAVTETQYRQVITRKREGK